MRSVAAVCESAKPNQTPDADQTPDEGQHPERSVGIRVRHVACEIQQATDLAARVAPILREVIEVTLSGECLDSLVTLPSGHQYRGRYR